MRICLMDMEGMLLDRFPAWREAERAVFARQGIPLPDGSAECLCLQMTRDASGTAALLRMDIDMAFAVMRQELDARFASRFDTVACPKPGAEAFLRTLAKKDIPCWVVTSADPGYRTARFPSADFCHTFSGWCTRGMRGPKKEDPEFYRRMAQTLDMDTTEILAVEDSLGAVQSDKAAGCAVFGIIEGAHGTDDAMRALCDQCAGGFTAPIDRL